MIQDIDLRELSEHEGAGRAFLSVYACGKAGAQAIESRLNALRTLLEDEGGGPALDHFDQNARMVREWLADHPPGRGTACVFACYALDLLRGFQLDLELPTDVRIGVAPYVRPLAELQDEYRTFAIVAADNEATRVLLVTAREREVAGRIRGDVKNHVKKGGWSQKRYQRRRDKELQQYAGEVARFLSKLSREETFHRIVLLGSEETMIAIDRELDETLRERVIAREAVDLKSGDEALVAGAFEEYRNAERVEERQLWRRIRAEYKSGGLAAVGATDVLGAVRSGRVEAILVERDANIRGVRCNECDNTAHGAPETCLICGSASVVEIDLVNEVTRQAEMTGAEVEYADPIPALTKVGGVAALLRY